MQKLGLDAETAAAKINDVLRYTLSFDPSSYAEAVQKVQETLRKDGWEKYDSKWKNFFVDDDMKYSGYHNIWVNGDGIRFELQYHTPESFKRKKLSHAAFKAFQATAPNSPERNQRYQDMIDAWEGFESPPGVENLEGIIP
jgi:hypothetical protein